MRFKKQEVYNLKKAKWGEILTAASGVASMVPGGQVIGAVGGIAGMGLSAWEANNERLKEEQRMKQEQLQQSAQGRLQTNLQNYDLNIPTFAYGGQMPPQQVRQQQVTPIAGNTHEQGGTNLANVVEAEQGEAKQGNVIYSDRLKIEKKDLDRYQLPKKYLGKTIADIAKDIESQFSLRKLDSLDNKEKQRRLDDLTQIQEVKKVEQENKTYNNDLKQGRVEITPEMMQDMQGIQQQDMMGQQAQMQQQVTPEMQQQMMMQQQGGQIPMMMYGGRLPKAAFGRTIPPEVNDKYKQSAEEYYRQGGIADYPVMGNYSPQDEAYNASLRPVSQLVNTPYGKEAMSSRRFPLFSKKTDESNLNNAAPSFTSTSNFVVNDYGTSINPPGIIDTGSGSGDPRIDTTDITKGYTPRTDNTSNNNIQSNNTVSSGNPLIYEYGVSKDPMEFRKSYDKGINLNTNSRENRTSTGNTNSSNVLTSSNVADLNATQDLSFLSQRSNSNINISNKTNPSANVGTVSISPANTSNGISNNIGTTQSGTNPLQSKDWYNNGYGRQKAEANSNKGVLPSDYITKREINQGGGSGNPMVDNSGLFTGIQGAEGNSNYTMPVFDSTGANIANKAAYTSADNTGDPNMGTEFNFNYEQPNAFLSNLGGMYDIARGIHGLLKPQKKFSRIKPDYVRASYVDPQRALQDVSNSYGSAANVVRNNSIGGGNYMSNMLALKGQEGQDRARTNQAYDEANVGIANQYKGINAQMNVGTQQANSQIQQYEEMVNQQERDVASNMIQGGLTDMSGHYLQRQGDQNQYNMQTATLPFLSQNNIKVYQDKGKWYYKYQK